MHRYKVRVWSLIALTLFWVASVCAADPAAKPRKDVLGMRAVPDGHYLVSLKSSGKEHLVNVLVNANGGEFVKATLPQLTGARGKFELIGNGVFMVFFQNEKYRATQFWVFNGDGTA